MLGYLPYERIVQSATKSHPTKPYTAYKRRPMSLPPSTTTLYKGPPSTAIQPYSTMAYRPPPAYDCSHEHSHSASLMELQETNSARNIKVEEYYAPPPYGYGQAQVSTRSSNTTLALSSLDVASTTLAMGGLDVASTTMAHPIVHHMAHPMAEGPKVLDISPLNMEQNATLPVPGSGPVPAPAGDELEPKSESQPQAESKAKPVPEKIKDEVYWEKRKKNNESAKRSREQRRLKERKTVMWLAFLEHENVKLRTQFDALKAEIRTLKQMLHTP